MRRRSLLAALPTAVALGGCSVLASPDLRMETGSGHLRPASQRQIANGLQPDGDDAVYATVAPDEARDLVTPDTSDALVDTLSNDGGDVFTLVAQLRSTPESPMALWLAFPGEIQVRGETLHADVTVEPWGSFDDSDESLSTAEELVYTGVWNLTPEPRTLPDKVDLHLRHRG